VNLRGPLIGVAVPAVLVAACQLLPAEPADLEGTAWQAVAVAGQPPVAGAEPTIRFDGARLTGSTGCNTFGAGYGIVGERFSVGELVMTEIACAGPIAEQERRFVEALLAVEWIRLGPGQLSLAGLRDSLDFVPG